MNELIEKMDNYLLKMIDDIDIDNVYCDRYNMYINKDSETISIWMSNNYCAFEINNRIRGFSKQAINALLKKTESKLPKDWKVIW